MFRSDIAWKDAKYAQIWEYLTDEFVLTQRLATLDFKLKFVEVNYHLFAYFICVDVGNFCISLGDRRVLFSKLPNTQVQRLYIHIEGFLHILFLLSICLINVLIFLFLVNRCLEHVVHIILINLLF